MRRRLPEVALSVVLAIVPTFAFHGTATASPTSCDTNSDWTAEYTSLSPGFYHPENGGCLGTNAYFGWAGVDGQIQTPSHAPNLQHDTTNHSLGWLEMAFSDRHSWVQVGWLGGCVTNGTVYACADLGTIGIYDEEQNGPTGAYAVGYDGAASLNTGYVLRVEFYPPGCWQAFDMYDNLLRSLCAPGPWSFPTSGAAIVASETCNCASPFGSGPQIEMPVTLFGSSNPNTNNGLRVKGANGYVPWTTSLSSGSTAYYDERNCPNASCVGSPAYWVSAFNPNYYFEAFGNTS